MLGGYLVDDAQGCKLINWLTSVLSELDEHLEGYFDFNNSTKDIKQLADALRRLELHSLVLLGQARLNILNESLCSPLVQSSVVQQRLLDIPDQLALGNGRIDLGLGQLEQKLEA